MNQNSLTSTSENVSFQRSKNNFAICPALWYLTAVPQFRYKLETIAGVQQMKCSYLCLWQQWFHMLQVLTLKCQHNNSMARNPLLCDTAVLVFFYCWRHINSFIYSFKQKSLGHKKIQPRLLRGCLAGRLQDVWMKTSNRIRTWF